MRPRISDEATVQQVEAFYIDKYGEPSRWNALSGDGLNIDIYVWDSKSPDGVTLYFSPLEALAFPERVSHQPKGLNSSRGLIRQRMRWTRLWPHRFSTQSATSLLRGATLLPSPNPCGLGQR